MERLNRLLEHGYLEWEPGMVQLPSSRERLTIDSAQKYLAQRGMKLDVASVEYGSKGTTYNVIDSNGKKTRLSTKEIQRLLMNESEVVQQERMIFITAPHAQLQEHENIHPFDYRARAAAQALAEAFIAKLGESQVRVLYADRPRSDIDLNRPEAENLPWRKQLDQAMAAAIQEGKQVFAFDVHSFGPEDKAEWTGKQMVILYPTGRRVPELERGDVVGMEAATRDSILYRAVDRGAVALLFEFNESPDVLTPDELKDLCDRIVTWAMQYKMLKEMPHVELPGGEYFDFERERKPGWLKDLIKLFRQYRGREDELIDSLENNLGFATFFKLDFEKATPELQRMLKATLPKEFLYDLLKENQMKRLKTVMEMAMAVIDPSRGHMKPILDKIRSYFNNELDNIEFREYLTKREGTSNKYHYFLVFESESGGYQVANATGRIGYNEPQQIQVHDMGEYPDREQAIKVAKKKLNKKLASHYVLTKV